MSTGNLILSLILSTVLIPCSKVAFYLSTVSTEREMRAQINGDWN